MIFRSGRLYLASTSSGSERIRWTITGTAARTSARLCSAASSVPSGSKRRRRTIVETVGRLITKWKKPQEWKSGAAIIIVIPRRKGILSISEAIAINPSGLERWAPFGVPVVPEVRITNLGLSGGGLWSDSSPASISASRVGASVSPSHQATMRATESSTPESSSPNSSS